MEKLKSEKFELPTVFFIQSRDEIKELPIGVPYILGDIGVKDYLIRILEYEVLYQNAIKTGLPFNFKKLLEEAGYKGLESFYYSHPIYMDFDETRGDLSVLDIESLELTDITKQSYKFKDFVRDNSVHINIEKLKSLNVFPVWMEKIEEAVTTNIHNFAVYNPYMYNKKLDGMYGDVVLSSPKKSLIVIDISGSIPKAVSTTCLILAKNLAESFYADILITGSKSTLYDYNDLYKLDVESVYDENGMDNDQVYFRRLLTRNSKEYQTAIVFGDNHSWRQQWSNRYNHRTFEISLKDGKRISNWKAKHVIAFHTSDYGRIPGYGDCFNHDSEEHIENWVTYLN